MPTAMFNYFIIAMKLLHRGQGFCTFSAIILSSIVYVLYKAYTNIKNFNKISHQALMQQSWVIPRMRLPVYINGHLYILTISVLLDWFCSVSACTGITGKHRAISTTFTILVNQNQVVVKSKIKIT